jgi:hypothetical protein
MQLTASYTKYTNHLLTTCYIIYNCVIAGILIIPARKNYLVVFLVINYNIIKNLILESKRFSESLF